MSATQLPAPRLVVTSHDDKGNSIFASDSQVPAFFPFGPHASSFSVFHKSETVPTSNTAELSSLEKTLPRCPPNGVIFCTSDIQPGGKSPMHRTTSTDYAVILSGEIVVRLDTGEEKTIKTGECIVQRGANHEWINRSNEVCRLLCVLVGSEKIVLGDGTVLEETVIGR
jgi:quercetin dioxygenase-like cupin family protein